MKPKKITLSLIILLIGCLFYVTIRYDSFLNYKWVEEIGLRKVLVLLYPLELYRSQQFLPEFFRGCFPSIFYSLSLLLMGQGLGILPSLHAKNGLLFGLAVVLFFPIVQETLQLWQWTSGVADFTDIFVSALSVLAVWMFTHGAESNLEHNKINLKELIYNKWPTITGYLAVYSTMAFAS
jgi:hypothetical protein